MLMSAQDYRDSLRRYRPRVYVDGRAVESVADEPALAPGVNAPRCSTASARTMSFATAVTQNSRRSATQARSFRCGIRVR